MKSSRLDFETLAAQAGLKMPAGDAVATAPPIVASSTFTYDRIQDVHHALTPEGDGYAYARNANPTVRTLEEALARLEGADEVIAFGSGMAAIHATVVGAGLPSGAVILAASDLYGVTRALFTYLEDFDIHTEYVDVLDLPAVENALDRFKTRLLYFESVSNPMLRVPDTRAIVELARQRRVVVAIDNTFATPYLFRPLAVGAHIVIHSATKYIAGHGDTVAGVVATDQSLGRRIRDARTVTGGIVSPFEAWLTLRGVRTLPLRMARHCESALEVARWLDSRPWVKRVHYPGLDSHPQQQVASEQFAGRFGGMIACELCGGREDTLRYINELELVTAGTSLGDVESLVLYPPLSSHRGLSVDQLAVAGITEGLFRLSVGLESPRDLIADMEHAAATLPSDAAEVPGEAHPVS
ncbi:MAG: methionine gamma-lyase [Chloroflexota bacterium]